MKSHEHPINFPFQVNDIPNIPFTVVISCFNKSKVIGQTIKILQASEICNFKIICVDDCSTDNTFSILQQFPGIHIIRNESNLGWGASNNKALSIVDTEYVVFLDADFFPGTFGWLTTWWALNREKEFGESGQIHYCPTIFNMPEIYNFLKTRPWVDSNNVFCQKIIGKDNSISVSGHVGGDFKIFKTDFLKTIGGFDNSPFPVNVEVEISIRLQRYGYSLLPYRIPYRWTITNADGPSEVDSAYQKTIQLLQNQKQLYFDTGALYWNAINLEFPCRYYRS